MNYLNKTLSAAKADRLKAKADHNRLFSDAKMKSVHDQVQALDRIIEFLEKKVKEVNREITQDVRRSAL